MKIRLILIVTAFFMVAGISANAQCPGSKVPCKPSECKSAKKQVVEKGEITVYYFHNSRRCATCEAVEKETISALNELYPENVKDGKIVFISIDIEDGTHDKLVKDLEISGQTLLIISGDEKVNLTNDAFMYAKTKPEKLKAKIQRAIDKFV